MTQYRYKLTRRFRATGPIYCFIGVNPSTATEEDEDATTRKWNGFVTRWGGAGYITVNLFAARATDVSLLQHMSDPVGPGNDDHIRAAIHNSHTVVPCWGRASKMPHKLRWRIDAVKDMLPRGRTICFGLCADGQPKHPLMLGYDTEMENYHVGIR